MSLDDFALVELIKSKDVLFVDEATPREVDMDIARQIGGADSLELIQGYTGQGIRAEVMDSGLRTTHNDFQSNPALIHAGNGSSTSHGTSVYGIVFGDGATNAQGRGMLPDAEQPIFAAYTTLGDRMAHTARLVDPTGQYRAVFQTNSWGNARTRDYTTISAEMDEILFTQDILILQSQSNAGNQDSRPQAWAKNVLSVGGVRHGDTLDRADDQWNNGASIGPASDGRIKPDLWHFYDLTFAPSSSSNTAYTQFGGTSGATPVTAGHAGLMFQMWADGVFSGGPGQARDAFDVRPHMTTAKALLIHSAFQYAFSGTSDDKARVHQGWGMADVQNLYDIAQSNGWQLPILVDESSVLTPGAVDTYSIQVNGSSPLKATMVYADPAGNPSAARHRVNDLSLRLVSPSGTVYWGNNGLSVGVWSTPGGSSNVLDTVENVFIQSPEAGTWTVEVRGDEIVQDGHLETAALDADYALVVTHTDGSGGGNTPPVLDPIGPQSVVEEDTLTFTVSASDGDGDTIVLSASSVPPNASFDPATGLFTFTPSATQAGVYDVVFRANDGQGGIDVETVTITVLDSGQSYATLPYTADFESGALDEFWSTETSASVGRIQVTGANGPRGSSHLTMDVTTNGNYNTNEARLHLDLSGQTQVDLAFWWKEFSDEDDEDDGVFLSDDGGATFVKVYDL
ncbi:MAG: S8 family serine peptidase, partial [Myxococcota bacterium]